MKLACYGMVLLVLASCTAPKGLTPAVRGGDEVNNGGDLLSKRFELGRAKAVRILEAVVGLEEADLPGRFPSGRWEEVRAFYRQHRASLLDDVARTPEYQWANLNPNGACGTTGSTAYSPVTLSYVHCRDIETVTQAAVFLIGESVHHRGIARDGFAAAVASAIGSAWNRVLGLTPEGDAQRFLFEQGRDRAALMLSRLGPGDLLHAATDTDLANDGDRLISAQEKVAERVRASRHEWVDEFPAPIERLLPCFRQPDPAKKILELSLTACPGLVKDKGNAAFVLLVAAIRAELGISDEKSLGLAHWVQRAWAEAGHPESPHWSAAPSLPTIAAHDSLDRAQSVWTGQAVLAWTVPWRRDAKLKLSLYPSRGSSDTFDPGEQHITFWRYQPESKGWSQFLTPNVLSDHYRTPFRTDDAKTLDRSVGLDDGFLTITQCYRQNRNDSAGQRFFLPSRSWEIIPREGVPDRRDFQLFSAGKDVVLWGGRDCVTDRPQHSGAYYDTNTREWREIPGFSSDRWTEEPSVVVAGRTVVVWGGATLRGGIVTPSNRGWSFDLDAFEWIDIPTTGAPEPRFGHQAVGTDDSLIVLGGTQGEPNVTGKSTFDYSANKLKPGIQGSLRPEEIRLGGRFHLKRRKWLSVSPEGAPTAWYARGDLGSSVVWAKPNLIVLGPQGYLYHPARDRWSRLESIQTPRGLWRDLFWTGVELLLWSGEYNLALFP